MFGVLDVSELDRSDVMVFQQSSDEIVVQPQGRLDSQGGNWLHQQFSAIAPKRYKFWVIDLSSVEFIDSSGLVSLVTGLNVATQAGARLILCGLRPSAQLIFDITQLDRVFTIFENYDALLLALVREEVRSLEPV
jgi:anti-sigma B factor antagonist